MNHDRALIDGEHADDVGPLHPMLPLLLGGNPTPEQIDRLEAAMLAAEAAGVAPPDLPLSHHHGGGMYARQVLIPAGTVLTGLAHKHDHLNVCVGSLSVWTEAGMQRFDGINVVPSKAGARRVGYAHTDCTWIAIHANPSGTTDPDELAALMVDNPERLLERRSAERISS